VPHLRSLDRIELEHEGLLAADSDEPSVLQEEPRLDVALLDLALDAVLSQATRPLRDLREHRRADPQAAAVGDDGDVAHGVQSPRLDESARDRLLADACDQVGEPVLGLEVEAQDLHSRVTLRRHQAADVDHRLEVGVRRRRRDRELRKLELLHVISSSVGGSYWVKHLSDIHTTSPGAHWARVKTRSS
jgi:hypothetical protein